MVARLVPAGERLDLGPKSLRVVGADWMSFRCAGIDPPEVWALAHWIPGADKAGCVDLVATSPPYACEVGTIDKEAWLAGRSLCDRGSLNYSPSRTNLGHARGDAYLAEMAEVYESCHSVLRPGGLLVTVTKNLRRRGRCFDLAAATVALARQVGFTYRQHVIALLCAVRGSELVARPSFWQLTQTRKARSRGLPAHLVAHEDVLVFAKAEDAGG